MASVPGLYFTGSETKPQSRQYFIKLPFFGCLHHKNQPLAMVSFQASR